MMKDNNLATCSSYVKVQRSIVDLQPVWSKKPRFDKHGRPVEYLNWTAESCKQLADSISKDNKFYHQDRFAKDLECNFLARPAVSRKRKAAEEAHKTM